MYRQSFVEKQHATIISPTKYRQFLITFTANQVFKQRPVVDVENLD